MPAQIPAPTDSLSFPCAMASEREHTGPDPRACKSWRYRFWLKPWTLVWSHLHGLFWLRFYGNRVENWQVRTLVILCRPLHNWEFETTTNWFIITCACTILTRHWESNQPIIQIRNSERSCHVLSKKKIRKQRFLTQRVCHCLPRFNNLS